MPSFQSTFSATARPGAPSLRLGLERVHTTGQSEIAGITREAKLYGLKELARRAGVTAGFFRSWRVEFGEKETTIYVQPGTQKRIRFKNAPPSYWHELSAGTFRTTRAEWLQAPPEPLRTSTPDLVVPFSHQERNGRCPLFIPVDGDCVESGFDLPVSVLFSLSRWEENLAGDRDEHGRFSASMSLAFRDAFLNRPVVDECGLALEQVLSYLLPVWRPVERKLRVKLSHDIDQVGLPFNFRSAVGHTLRRHRPLATARDMMGGIVGVNPTYLESVRQIVQLSLEHGLNSAVYWKNSPPGRWDSGYDPRDPRVREVIRWLHERGVETGVHPGYETFGSPDRLQREVQGLREVLGEQPLGGRQHYLRWCPDTWRDWENCGLAYDSTVGYADQIGFRAGTCVPYRPWLLSLNREAKLIEVPLIVMDGTLVVYMHLTPRQGLAAVLECLDRCRSVGGVFTLLWHNSSLIDSVYGDLYRNILEALVGHETLDWMTPSDDLY